jgi:transposase
LIFLKISRAVFPFAPHVTVGLLKRRSKTGDVQILCTSLLEDAKYSHKSIITLYHERWNIEEAYKFIKTRLDVEDWSGKTALSVLQDFFAKTLLITLCNIMCFKIKPKVKTKPEKITKRPVIINRT